MSCFDRLLTENDQLQADLSELAEQFEEALPGT